MIDIHTAVLRGTVPDNFSTHSPGSLNHARWLTTANRTLRLYASTEKPDKTLETLAKFVMLVYAPMWFIIKTNSCKVRSKAFIPINYINKKATS